jgi:ATP-dependent DNA helicase PIF1
MSQEEAFGQFQLRKNLFITGAGGTGKTTLIHRMTDYLSTRDISYKVCALTGCAALLLGQKATTFHSWAGVGLSRGTVEECVAAVMKNKFTQMRIRKTKVLFVDEISMMSKKLFDIFYEIVSTLNPRMQIIFTGDFFQLPPVGNASDPDTSAFCFESAHWFAIFPAECHLELTHIYRQNDPVYIDLLQSVRVGNITETQIELLRSKVSTTAPDLEQTGGVVPPKLYSIKRQVDTYNYMTFSNLEGEVREYTYEALINLTCWNDTGVPLAREVLAECARLSPAAKEYEIGNILSLANCREKISLKVGCVVMLTMNIDLENGLCNGSQGVVMSFAENGYPLIKFKTCTQIVAPIVWQSDNYPSLGIRMMPLILSWAVTIHKIQGTTLENAVMDLGNTVFEYGQVYVALSRVKSLDGLFLEGFNPKKIKANPKVVEFYLSLMGRGFYHGNI